MSKIGKKPIVIPDGVEVKLNGNVVEVKGPKGKLSEEIKGNIVVEIQDKEILVKNDSTEAQDRAFHGLYRSLIDNMVVGTSAGFTKVLELVGTGYRAKLSGKKLEMSLGLSHPVIIEIPSTLECSMEGQTKITIGGINKQEVGQFAANIRKIRPPEPYKGKGIRYEGEVVRRKAGKTGK